MERRIDIAMASLFGILGLITFAWTFNRYAELKEVELHTAAGHELKVVPIGYKSAWSAPDRGVAALIKQLQDEENANYVPQSSISKKH